MKLNDIVTVQDESNKEVVPTHTSNEEIEKLAEVLEAIAEEDTLLDDLARAAVALEIMEKRYGQKGNA